MNDDYVFAKFQRRFGGRLSIVVPVYKEAGNIRPFLQRTEAVMEKLGVSYEIIFALDPSPDDTEAVILREIERNPAVKLILFSRRFGQPAATMAGILNCTGEKCVVIDVDLQDPAGAHRTALQQDGRRL